MSTEQLCQETSHDDVDKTDLLATKKRRASITVEGLQQASVDATVMKKQKLTYNFVAALDINFPKHNRGMVASSLVETISCESQNKNRFYLTPINESFIIEPDHGRISIRDVQTLAEVRAILLKTNNNMDISACRMIPGRSNAIAGDQRGNLYHLNLQKAHYQLIDWCNSRGGILDLAFSTPTRFIVVGENKECSFNELEGTEVRRLSERFEDSQLIRKTIFLDENRFVAGQSFHNLRIFDVELLKVSRKIPTEGSIYTMCRLDRNRFCYGGSTNEISHYDCRSQRVVMTMLTKENWTGVIRHLSQFSLVYSDWRTIVLTDVRKGQLNRYQTKSRSGIWDAYAVNQRTLLTSSSDCRIVKMDIVC